MIEGGRATADLSSNEIKYNFYNSTKRQMISATWFVKEEKPSKVFTLNPMKQNDATIVEGLYQKAVQATSSLGSGINAVLQEENELQDQPDFRVVIAKSTSNVLTMKMKAKGWFGATFDLQRGYGEYSIEGEEDEVTLGPVKHLVFVVHGIGEALWSRKDVSVPSIIEEMNRTRIAIQRKQVAAWKKECEKSKKTGELEPLVPYRIELLPIEWFDRIHSSSSALMKSLKATTLQTIPALRAIANDVILDVMMYLTPDFCKIVLECVSTQIDDLFHRFQEVHPNFSSDGGKCSLIGHSLGSVIVWDLLSVLKDLSEGNPLKQCDDVESEERKTPRAPTPLNDSPFELGYQAYARETGDTGSHPVKDGSWGPLLKTPMTHAIPFVPEFTIFLGSPIGLFLTLRGAHAVFDEILERAKMAASEEVHKESTGKEDLNKSITSPFSLPSGSIFNIFHPSDPVAYRIEPLLMPRATVETMLPPPQYLVKKGKKVRLHVQAMQLGDDIRRTFTEKTSNWSSLIASVTEQAVSAIQSSTEKTAAEPEKEQKGKKNKNEGHLKFALGGKSERVDFQLQTSVVDNEYFSAVMAHSSYFTNGDFQEFLLDLADVTPIHNQSFNAESL